jgi:hypothetical protein
VGATVAERKGGRKREREREDELHWGSVDRGISLVEMKMERQLTNMYIELRDQDTFNQDRVPLHCAVLIIQEVNA